MAKALIFECSPCYFVLILDGLCSAQLAKYNRVYMQMINAHFDTKIGSKTEKSSYTAIAQGLGFEPTKILFVSDNINGMRYGSLSTNAGAPCVVVYWCAHVLGRNSIRCTGYSRRDHGK